MKWADQAGVLARQEKTRKAVLLYWKAAKGFAQLQMLQDLVSTLAALIALLEDTLPLLKVSSSRFLPLFFWDFFFFFFVIF